MFEFDPVFLSLGAARKFERQTQRLLAEKAEKGNSAQKEVCMSGEKKFYVVALSAENGLSEPMPFDTKGKTVEEAVQELRSKKLIVVLLDFNEEPEKGKGGSGAQISITYRALRCAIALSFGIVDVSEADITYKRSTPWWTSAGYRRILGKGWMPKQTNHPDAAKSPEGWVIPNRIPRTHWRNVGRVAGMFKYLASGNPVLFIVNEKALKWLQWAEKRLVIELNSHLAGVRQDREARRETRRAAGAAFVEAMAKSDPLFRSALAHLEEYGTAILEVDGQIHRFRSPVRLATFIAGAKRAGYEEIELLSLE